MSNLILKSKIKVTYPLQLSLISDLCIFLFNYLCVHIRLFVSTACKTFGRSFLCQPAPIITLFISNPVFPAGVSIATRWCVNLLFTSSLLICSFGINACYPSTIFPVILYLARIAIPFYDKLII